MDKRTSLWGGYAVFTKKARFWFAGDTGYCPVFSQIGRKYGPFDLAAIPIGAYDPRSFMKAMHVNPGEAVQIHKVSSTICLFLDLRQFNAARFADWMFASHKVCMKSEL